MGYPARKRHEGREILLLAYEIRPCFCHGPLWDLFLSFSPLSPLRNVQYWREKKKKGKGGGSGQLRGGRKEILPPHKKQPGGNKTLCTRQCPAIQFRPMHQCNRTNEPLAATFLPLESGRCVSKGCTQQQLAVLAFWKVHSTVLSTCGQGPLLISKGNEVQGGRGWW